jgi:phosphatidylinositol alpha-1,6-mannosyltransferase
LVATLAGVRPRAILAHGAELLPAEERWRRPLWEKLQRRVLESADLVIANSEYTARLVSAAAPKAKVKAIPLGVDPERFTPGEREAAKQKLGVAGKRALCTVARVVDYKGHGTVLRAIASLTAEERKELVYLVVGEGPYLDELKKLARELQIEALVQWHGFVPEDELPLVYRASDLFVLCTREAPGQRSVEGFGLVFLEAQACGTPVVATRTGGIPDAVKDGDGGWLIEQDDAAGLTDIIRKLVHSPERFRAAGIRARERVLRECTWDTYMQRFSAALEGIGNRE